LFGLALTDPRESVFKSFWDGFFSSFCASVIKTLELPRARRIGECFIWINLCIIRSVPISGCSYSFNMQFVLLNLIALVGIAAVFPGKVAGRPKLALTAEPEVRGRQVPIDLAAAVLNFQEPQSGEV
jgi:hypothetical protein